MHKDSPRSAIPGVIVAFPEATSRPSQHDRPHQRNTASLRLKAAHLDTLGGCASGACAIHCAITALAPALVAGSQSSHLWEWAVLIPACVVGIVAMAWGYQKHRQIHVSSFLLVGVLGLIGARALEESDYGGGSVIMILAGIVLMLGHWMNHRASRCRNH